MLRFQGLGVIHKEFQDDCGLPRQLTLDTLKDEQYMYVSRSSACLFGCSDCPLLTQGLLRWRIDRSQYHDAS